MSRAVRVGNMISVSGTAPIGENGETVGVGDVAVQARRCFEIAKKAVEDAGGSLSNVVRTRTMLLDIDDWKSVAKIRAEYFKDIRPADTVVQVSRFVNPDWLLEIEVDAIIE